MFVVNSTKCWTFNGTCVVSSLARWRIFGNGASSSPEAKRFPSWSSAISESLAQLKNQNAPLSTSIGGFLRRKPTGAHQKCRFNLRAPKPPKNALKSRYLGVKPDSNIWFGSLRKPPRRIKRETVHVNTIRPVNLSSAISSQRH